MKTFISIILIILFFIQLTSAQSNPKSSSRSAAQYDAASIDENISDNRDVIYFSQVGIERGTIAETKNLARDMLADIVVLTDDIFSGPASRLTTTEVAVTIADGKVVYRRDPPENTTAQ